MCFISIVCDGMSTYFASPNLKYEYNYIVRVWGGGWTELIAQNIVFFLAISLLYWFAFQKSEIKYVTDNSTKLDFKTFIKNYFHFDFFRKNKHTFFLKLNTQFNWVLVKGTGYVLISTVTIIRFIIALQNMLYGFYYQFDRDHLLSNLGYNWSILNRDISEIIGFHFSQPTSFFKDILLMALVVFLVQRFLKIEYLVWKTKVMATKITSTQYDVFPKRIP